MQVLVDTNVLLRAVQKTHPLNRSAREAVRSLLIRGDVLCITLQNMAEFWNVCTREQQANGLGMSIEAAGRQLARMERIFAVLPDSAAVITHWRKLVVDHAVRGVKVHDAHLVASMQAWNIRQILTFNVADFARFGNVQALHPDQIS